MKLLVTGGLGFIGSNFVRHILATHQDEVTNLDNLSTGSNPANLTDSQGNKNYRFVRGDIRDKNVVNGLVREVDAVVNFAAETHVDRSIADPTQFYENNVIGTLALLEAVRCFNPSCRLLQVSTDEVYGDTVKGSFIESDALRPSSPYSASKAASDLAALAHHRTFGLNVTVTRCTNNYGPHQFPEKLVPKTIVRAALGLPIPVYGSGKNVRDWIHVSDHCRAIEAVLRNGRSGEIYNISSGNELTNIDIVRKILGIMGKPLDLITHVEDRPGHDIRYSLDSSKLRKELRWITECSLDSSLEKTVNWYMSNEDWWRPLATEEVLDPTPWKRK